MRIGLLALETGRKVGGLESYEVNLIRALARVDDINEYHVLTLDPGVPEELGVLSRNFRYHVFRTNRWKGVMWDLPLAMKRLGLDLFHAPFVPPPFTSVPYVFTHHGTEVMERPDFYPLALGLRMRALFRRAFTQAGLIICVSHYVRDFLINARGFAPARLETVHNACAPEFYTVDSAAARERVAERYGLTEPYILTVGRIEPRKNPIRLLEAYDRFRRASTNPPKLVFAGMKTWSATEFDRTVARLGLTAHIVELGYVPTEDLPALYAAAKFAVYTSLWEGFGIPAIEALAAGTPLLSSRTTSIPEVTAGAAILVDPTSVEEIAEGLRLLNADAALRQALVEKGTSRARDFSWDKTARETIQVYERLYRNAR